MSSVMASQSGWGHLACVKVAAVSFPYCLRRRMEIPMKIHFRTVFFATVLALPMVAAEAQAAKVTILHRFKGMDGTNPPIALTLGPDGRLYGGTIEGGKFDRGTVFAIDPLTGNFKTLHHFADDEGLNPFGQLLLASDGFLYGTTRSGGDDNVNCYGGCGTIYRIAPSGRVQTLHFMKRSEERRVGEEWR